MKKSFLNKSKIILVLVLIFVIVSYFIWFNALESYTEEQRVDYPGNDIYKDPYTRTNVSNCLNHCDNIKSCKGIVTNFQVNKYSSKLQDRDDPPKCWFKHTMNNGRGNTNERYTYKL
jgi:hypothetical protein